MKKLSLNKQTIARLDSPEKIYGGEKLTVTCVGCIHIGKPKKTIEPTDRCETYGGNSCDPVHYYCQSDTTCNTQCQTDEFTCQNNLTLGPCI